MLVLTRKIDEQIVIGDDIKVTLLRVRGNSVRIGIEAPRDVRILRGEIELKLEDVASETKTNEIETNEIERADSEETDPQQEVFAHPQPNRGSRRGAPSRQPVPPQYPADRTPRLFVGRIIRDGDRAELHPAPLSGFMAAGSPAVPR